MIMWVFFTFQLLTFPIFFCIEKLANQKKFNSIDFPQGQTIASDMPELRQILITMPCLCYNYDVVNMPHINVSFDFK